jgi:ribosomal protein S18 acetylase RimI-like enzyme
VPDAAETFEIYNLHVAPERHGQGVGRALFAEALELARGAGARTLSLWVVESNANARRFYERQGMRADGARQVHPLGPGAELREMRYRRDVGDPTDEDVRQRLRSASPGPR